MWIYQYLTLEFHIIIDFPHCSLGINASNDIQQNRKEVLYFTGGC